MHEWTVASAVIEAGGEILLVRNRRRNGAVDWSTPGGVIDEGESVLEGLAREVAEETGIRVTEWSGLLYEVKVDAAELGWRAHIEVWQAGTFTGDLRVADPDGIVDDVRFVAATSCHEQLGTGHRWVREPFSEWLASRPALSAPLAFRYGVAGVAPDLVVTRLR